MPKKPTKAAIKKERSRTKLKKVLEKKGYKGGKLPKGKVAHHLKKVSEGGKTTKKNIKVISKAKHQKIHKKKNKPLLKLWHTKKSKNSSIDSITKCSNPTKPI